MTIGLGSGRAVWKVVELLGRARRPVRAPPWRRRAPTSWRAAAGFELVELDGTVELDLALDGADEVDPELRLIKGGGGALLREKIVISAARRFVVVAEASKRVERLGEHFRLPVEVVRFGWRDTRRRLAALLPDAEQRLRDDGEAYVTDEGHLILDCALPGGRRPRRARPRGQAGARRGGARALHRAGRAGAAGAPGRVGRGAGARRRLAPAPVGRRHSAPRTHSAGRPFRAAPPPLAAPRARGRPAGAPAGAPRGRSWPRRSGRRPGGR